MRTQRRRLPVSVTAVTSLVVLGLLVQAAPTASAAMTASAAPTASAAMTASAAPTASASPTGSAAMTAIPVAIANPAPRADLTPTRPLRSPVSNDGLTPMTPGHDSGQVAIAVTVRRGANDRTINAAVAGAARARGGKKRQTLADLDTVTVQVPPSGAKRFTELMRARADVARVELVPRRWPSQVPNDPKYPATASYLSAVNAPAAWRVATGNRALKIAIVDTGVDVNHPDLRSSVVGRYNAVDHSTNVTDKLGHGTFVAGVAAATGNNRIGIAGSSMGASILAVKVANSAGEIWSDAVASGIIWSADHGANIVNLSLGSSVPSQAESDAIAYATGKGALVVGAAGNDASSRPFYPAAYPDVVAVGAIDVAAHGRASFSQYGSWVTVAAPGVRITGTTPTAGSSFYPSRSGYAVGDGTSYASPIVAGEAALLWSQHRTRSAADIRGAIVASAHGYGNLGLGAGQVDFQAALRRLRPYTVPTLIRPTRAATVTGVVRLSVRSTAPKVRFLVNGTPAGAAVSARAGSASIAWPSWGSPNGPLSVRAVDCSIYGLCNATGAQVHLTLTNRAPVLTSPTAAGTVSGGATFTATAPGGGVAFVIDGVRRDFDATAPYLTHPMTSLADGAHTISALSCSAAGDVCGPASPEVVFTSESLHPAIKLSSPSVFSPNADGRHDGVRARYSLPDAQSVLFRVRNASGSVVRSAHLGTLGAGTRTLTWHGMLDNGTRATSGNYTLELATSGARAGRSLHGSAVARVRVDVTAPRITSVTGAGATFFPYRDQHGASFTARFRLSERAAWSLTVRTRGGAVVRRLSGPAATSPTTSPAASPGADLAATVWNGRDAAGSRVIPGTYYWTITAQDLVGNRRTSARYSVLVKAG